MVQWSPKATFENTSRIAMIIRAALPADLAGINAVHAACGRTAWDERVLDDPDRCVMVALVGGVVVGAGKTHHQRDAAPPATSGYYLGGVTVHPDHRRRGIGRALTRARIEWVWERADAVLYFTDDDNVASMRLHADFGFVEIVRAPEMLGSRANGANLVLFMASRPE